MAETSPPSIDSSAQTALRQLAREFTGDIRSDRLYRSLYATDASIYQIVPDGVLLPRSAADIQAAVRTCAQHGVPITPRGAGTGLTGGAVNRGIQLDCSRFLNRIISIDPHTRTAVVEPGVVLDQLNAEASKYGLHFAPDVAPSSRATIGGMIANNSCGAHSVIYGRTVDHILALQVILSDGSIAWWGCPEALAGLKSSHSSELVHQCEQVVASVIHEEAAEINRRFPKILRSNGGYGLDRLQAKGRLNMESLICGSEGTLAIVSCAVLKLTPLPKHRGMVVAHYHELLDALSATPAALEHKPAAVELLDKLLIEAARASPGMSREIALLQGEPEGVLIIELYDDDASSLQSRLKKLADDLRQRGMGYAWPIITDAPRQADVWKIRKAGLGLLMSRPGQRQPYDFVDDTAVDPTRLREYIARFMQILREEGVEQSSYYAHASVGCLHVKPVLNLRRLGDVERMYRVSDRISSLALEFSGSMTGEHGDGIVRGVWAEKMFGPRLVDAFRRIKRAFDPGGILNPGKIVDPYSMTAQLRWKPTSQPSEPKASLTVLDFQSHGGMEGLAEMCSGVGQCRQKLVGTMCPSYMATGDELHTTRARANALRLALSDDNLISGLDDPALDEVMDLCISCKACKTECPTGVDMARLKAEWLHHRNQHRGVSLRTRLVTGLPQIAKTASQFAPIVNLMSQSAIGRWLGEVLVRMDRRMPLPRLAAATFREWYAHRPPIAENGRNERVCLFVDTWTNYFAPQIGIAAVQVFDALGIDVSIPETVCCGRPAISKGMLDEARTAALRNTEVLAPYAESGTSIVCLEPSCASALHDELPQFVRSPAARGIAQHAMPIENLLGRPPMIDRLMGLLPPGAPGPILFHGHCHQKALYGSDAAMAILRLLGPASEINSGCCGMAGSFGHEKEHYDVARAIGEDRLFPAIRQKGEAAIASSGFSCRQQIEHHTQVQPRHVVELLAERLRVISDPGLSAP